MKHLQYLGFEISNGCNLANIHAPVCPVRNPYRPTMPEPMPDGAIIHVAVKAYEKYGFNGMITWHFYNEPLLESTRMIRLMKEIAEATNKARFSLWTNGEFITEEAFYGSLPPFDLGLFSQIKVTNYFHRDFSWLHGRCPSVEINPGNLDKRTWPSIEKTRTPACTRIFNELVFDYYGFAHPCCMDWNGEINVGNIYSNCFETIYDNYLSLRNKVGAFNDKRMSENAPEKCLKCHMRSGLGNLVPEVYEQIRKEIVL